MRALAIALALLPSAALAGALPIKLSYCDSGIRLEASRLLLEDGACVFHAVTEIGRHQWKVETDCDGPNAALVVSTSLDDQAAAFADASGEAAFPLHRCR